MIGLVLHNLYTCLKYIVAPPICYSCKSFMHYRTVLCRSCDDQLLSIAPKVFKVSTAYTMTVHAVCRYDQNPIKQLILAKHRSDYVRIQGLANLMWEKTVLSYMDIDYVIPIPLHWSRYMKRGFNQAEVIAQVVAQKKGVKVFEQLVRTKQTQYQARLHKGDRGSNVKGAFSVQGDGSCLKNKHIVLIDDLCTTGATAIEAAKALVRYKPASISLVVASRAY